MTFLLDVNVIIALIDPMHVGHDAAHRWFEAQGRFAWATCPLTENGVIRIVGHLKYPNSPGSPAAVAVALAGFKSLAGHIFWPDDISLMANDVVDPGEIRTSAQVTDSYLLALAVAHGGRLATFDQRLSVKPVHGGGAALCVLPGG